MDAAPDSPPSIAAMLFLQELDEAVANLFGAFSC